jgi:hypothetical protein
MVTQESALEEDQSFVESCPAFFFLKRQNFRTVVKWATCALFLPTFIFLPGIELSAQAVWPWPPKSQRTETQVLAPLYFEIVGLAALLLDLHFQVCRRMWIPQDEAWRRTWIHQNQGWMEDTAVHKVRKAWSQNPKCMHGFVTLTRSTLGSMNPRPSSNALVYSWLLAQSRTLNPIFL